MPPASVVTRLRSPSTTCPSVRLDLTPPPLTCGAAPRHPQPFLPNVDALNSRCHRRVKTHFFAHPFRPKRARVNPHRLPWTSGPTSVIEASSFSPETERGTTGNRPHGELQLPRLPVLFFHCTSLLPPPPVLQRVSEPTYDHQSRRPRRFQSRRHR
jgi:hypothetical protein